MKQTIRNVVFNNSTVRQVVNQQEPMTVERQTNKTGYVCPKF